MVQFALNERYVAVCDDGGKNLQEIEDALNKLLHDAFLHQNESLYRILFTAFFQPVGNCSTS